MCSCVFLLLSPVPATRKLAFQRPIIRVFATDFKFVCEMKKKLCMYSRDLYTEKAKYGQFLEDIKYIVYLEP